MAKSFGNTWWGECWLKSLDHIDYQNRLPRGKTYARKGSVKEVKIIDNTITAKVAGSRPRPYKVDISVPSFAPSQIDQLMERIIEKPAIISKLLNRELDPELLHIAESLKLKVFPKQWSDFTMQCSCPDWAVPCKHLAATIYMVSLEIDNNPFLVFELHKLNLIKELNKRGIYIDNAAEKKVLLFSELIRNDKDELSEGFNQEDAYQRVDFSSLQPVSDALIQLLPDNPPFYHNGNFRQKYNTGLNRIIKATSRAVKSGANPGLSLLPLQKVIEISKHSELKFTTDLNAKFDAMIDGTAVTQAQLIKSLLELNPEHIDNYQPSVAASHQILLGALHLLANGAVVPRLVQLDNKKFSIRWMPALIDQWVCSIISKMESTIPPDLISVLQMKKKSPVGNATTTLISFFLNELTSITTDYQDIDEFHDLFFRNKPYDFAGVGENALSGGIKVWLDRYFMNSGQYRPVITVGETQESDFELSVAFEDKNSGKDLPIPLNAILTQKSFEKQRYEVLSELTLLSSFIKGLDLYINRQAKTPINFTQFEFTPFLIDIIPAIRLLDIKILLPKSLQQLLRPKTSIRIKKQSKAEKGFISLTDLLDFDMQIAIGDTLMSREEYIKLIGNASGLIKFKENYIYVDQNDLERLQKSFAESFRLSPEQILHSALMEEYDGAKIELSDEARELIKTLTAETHTPLPAGLNATLRPYQQRGYTWMYQNMQIGFGSVLADDMGLGKTLQVITLLLKLKQEQIINDKEKAIIIVPTGLLTNWQSEIERFAPGLDSFIYHGGNRDLELFNADVMITTYGSVRTDADLLKKKKWAIEIIDEAQNIKNNDTAQSKAVKSIKAKVRVAMSGTPVENRLSEFWSIMDFANKGYLGNLKSFNKDYSIPIQMLNDEQVISRFRKITAPFMLRRLKSDKSIISDLPDKVEQNKYATLTKEQAALYDQTLESAMKEIENINADDSQSLFKREGLVLQMILALKQICNHPAQFLKNGAFDSSLSGKSEMLLDLVESIVDSNEKVLIFTQFREMGEMLQRFINERTGEKPMFYHGGCSVKERQLMVDRFQNNRADKVFVLSLKAAGTGLNLTAATHVVHYDLWWNPAVEAQATDRAYRIGQKRNVQVHRFITKKTFEERIDQMIQKKKNLADLTVATGENWIGKLSNQELRELFS